MGNSCSPALPSPLPALGWVRIPGIPAAQQGPTRGEGRARNAWHPHLCPCKPLLGWARLAQAAPSHWAGLQTESREGLEWEGGDPPTPKTPFTRVSPKSCKAKHFNFPLALRDTSSPLLTVTCSGKSLMKIKSISSQKKWIKRPQWFSLLLLTSYTTVHNEKMLHCS